MIRGRHPGRFATFWAVLLFIGFMFWRLGVAMPALAELIAPFYWLLAVIGAVVTWRWFRARSPDNRRSADRRQNDRRDEP